MDGGLTFLQRLARLYRALSGLSQLAFGAKTGIDHILLARYEQGKSNPSPEHARCLAEGVDLTVEEGVEVLRFADTLRRPVQRSGLGREALLQEAGALGSRLAERVLRLPPGGPTPRAEDREHAAVLWARLQELPENRQLAVVSVGREFQSWALAERCCEESFKQASRRLDRAEFLALLAREIAERVPGPEGWRACLMGFAAAHLPNVRRVEGALGVAREGMEEAKRLQRAGEDPYGLLDPGRLLDLEASLCRDERDFPGALALHSEALPVSHYPGRSLVNKGTTLTVMGDYEGAREALLAAEPLVDRESDLRLRYKHRANLAVVCTHVGRYTEAAASVRQARKLVAPLEDEIAEIRLTGVEGRIAAGLGQPAEALRLLRHASRELAARNLWYSVALVDLEIAGLLLAEGRTAEVRTMAHELVEAFETRGVHVEAAKALRLFKEAVERDEAPPELAGRVLHYLFRAEHQPELAFAA